MLRDTHGGLRCSFCLLSTRAGDVAVDHPDQVITICADCVAGCNVLLAEDRDRTPLRPSRIKRRLDRDVIGQERVKRQLAVAVYNHHKRTSLSSSELELPKSNVLLIGPTGTGKTHLVRSLARLLAVPLHVGDATALTEAGYVGEDVESLLAGLLRAADGDLTRAQRGILYIDELDKVASRRGPAAHDGRDVGGEGVQQALLRLIEGTTVEVRVSGRGTSARTVQFDTSGVLVLCGGAFVGLDRVVRRRTQARSVGFGRARANEAAGGLADLRPEDLHAYGLIPEFTGRVPVIATLDPLDEDALVRILTEPRAALVKQYRRLFAMDGLRLQVTEPALRAIAQRCIAAGTGARGLRAELERVLLAPMYELPSREDVLDVWITEDTVAGAPVSLGLRSETG